MTLARDLSLAVAEAAAAATAVALLNQTLQRGTVVCGGNIYIYIIWCHISSCVALGTVHIFSHFNHKLKIGSAFDCTGYGT